MISVFSSKDQVLLFLLLFSLVLLLLAFLVDKSNGLFLARNPFDRKSYEPTPENEDERKAGMLFVKWTYQMVFLLVPLFLLFYSITIVKVLGILLIIINLMYRNSRKNSHRRK